MDIGTVAQVVLAVMSIIITVLIAIATSQSNRRHDEMKKDQHDLDETTARLERTIKLFSDFHKEILVGIQAEFGKADKINKLSFPEDREKIERLRRYIYRADYYAKTFEIKDCKGRELLDHEILDQLAQSHMSKYGAQMLKAAVNVTTKDGIEGNNYEELTRFIKRYL